MQSARLLAKDREPGGPYCSFCGNSKHEAKALIAGPSVFICNDCVGVCVNLLKGLRGAEGKPKLGIGRLWRGWKLGKLR
jgi:hypothetical protein